LPIRIRETASSAGGAPAPHKYPPAFRKHAGTSPEQRADGVKKIVGLADKPPITTPEFFSTEYLLRASSLARVDNCHSQTRLRFRSPCWQPILPAGKRQIGRMWQIWICGRWLRLRPENADSARPRRLRQGSTRSSWNRQLCWISSDLCFGIIRAWRFSTSARFSRDESALSCRRQHYDLGRLAHPLQTGSPFDGEGVQRQRVALVENGIVKRVVYARATAERMKRSEHKDKVGPIAATGHGFAFPTKWERCR